MEAVVFDGKTLSLSYQTHYPVPTITRDTDVIIKVEYSGICGTDVHIIQGEFPATKDRPLPLGHEFSGVIHEVGKATALKVGQKVVVDPNRSCSLCDYCRKGLYQHCATNGVDSVLGIWKDRGWAQNVVVPQDQVFVLPDAINTQQDTGYRLITPDVLAEEDDLYNVIIDCTGSAEAFNVSMNLLQPGGKYVVFGCCPATHEATVNPFQIYVKELTIIGAKVNPFSFPNTIAWLKVMGNRYLDYERLGVKTYALSDYEKAFQDVKAGEAAKAIFKL